MTKKRTGIAGGVKMASHMVQAAELLTAAQNMSPSKWQQFVYDTKEKVLMGAAIATVCGLFWLVSQAIDFFKN